MTISIPDSWRTLSGIKPPKANLYFQEVVSCSILYRQYVQDLFNYGMHACNNRELVTDCLREFFIHARNDAAKFNVNHQTRANVYASFRSLLLQNHPPLNPLSGSFANNRNNPTNFRAEAPNAIRKFSNLHREAVFLNFSSGFTTKEVAIIMDLDVRSVHTMINKFVTMLAKSTETPGTN